MPLLTATWYSASVYALPPKRAIKGYTCKGKSYEDLKGRIEAGF